MPFAVFLRGVNVGGHKTFRPREVAAALVRLDVVSIGAAGTFVVRGAATESQVRREFARHLPFDVPLMVCAAQEVSDLVAADPFPRATSAVGHFICILAALPNRLPSVPLRVPAGRAWQVEITAVRGSFVAARQRKGPMTLYPNEVVERRLGTTATTRSWATLLKVHDALRDDARPRRSRV